MEKNNNEFEIQAASEKDPVDSSRVTKSNVSPAVIRRLPRYFRYLRELIRQGQTRISSGELSQKMHVTASQIRQDLNCFGGFGQLGYGYNVNYLYAKICELLGVGCGFRAVIIGAGNLGMAIVRNPMFEKRGVDVTAMFDASPAVIGKTVGSIKVYDIKDFPKYCEENHVDIAVLTLPKEAAPEVADMVIDAGIRGIWNFTSKEIDPGDSGTIIENVHLGDSLMTLCYELCHSEEISNDEKNNF